MLKVDSHVLGSAQGGGGSRRGLTQDVSTGKLSGDGGGGGGGVPSAVKQPGTKKSKEDVRTSGELTQLDRTPGSNQDHGSSDHSSDMDRFFENSSKPHSKGPK